MPVNHRKDKEGKYFQWGDHGKKYYYKKESEKEEARLKALKQGWAISIYKNKKIKI